MPSVCPWVAPAHMLSSIAGAGGCSVSHVPGRRAEALREYLLASGRVTVAMLAKAEKAWQEQLAGGVTSGAGGVP